MEEAWNASPWVILKQPEKRLDNYFNVINHRKRHKESKMMTLLSALKYLLFLWDTFCYFTENTFYIYY